MSSQLKETLLPQRPVTTVVNLEMSQF